MIYIIYKISIADQCYIGSTKDFKQRKSNHKTDCNRIMVKLYDFIRENGGWDCCEMIPIEEFECEGLLQAQIREEYWRREYDAKLNSKKAHRTAEEKTEYNRNQGKIKYDENKDNIIKKIICECGSAISNNNKYQHFKTVKHQEYFKKNVAVIHNE
jgi:hypothetical protein